MTKQILVTLFIAIAIALNGCGFKPIHQITENSVNVPGYSIEIINTPSREIVDEINRSFIQKESDSFKVFLEIDESQIPLIINTNGTVSKYRIEIAIKYKLVKIEDNKVLLEDTARGFTQYDVTTSEIENEETRRQMIRTSAQSALQLMFTKIQSNLSKNNDH